MPPVFSLCVDMYIEKWICKSYMSNKQWNKMKEFNGYIGKRPDWPEDELTRGRIDPRPNWPVSILLVSQNIQSKDLCDNSSKNYFDRLKCNPLNLALKHLPKRDIWYILLVLLCIWPHLWWRIAYSALHTGPLQEHSMKWAMGA